MNLKSRSPQQGLQIAERAAFFRRYRAAADEIASDGEGIGRHD
jgi:hypothetical protein